MILKLRVEHMKDATGEKKRVLMATLLTDLPGMENINAVSELGDDCVLGREISKLMADMVELKQDELKKQYLKPAKKPKKVYPKKKS